MPALLQAQSSRPYVATTTATRAATSAALATSARAKAASPPFCFMSATVSFPPSLFTSDTKTLAPSSANFRAVARPIPAPEPVTSATYPDTRPIASLNLLKVLLDGSSMGCEASDRDVRLVQEADIATHSITSSARASTDGGIVRPSAFAVLRLITSWYLVAACTGRSAGFSPLRMRST